jgi:hypothetical protein
MIDANELRIGNIFWEDYGGYKIVTAINCNNVGEAPDTVLGKAIGGTVSGMYSCSAISPIPLSADILEKCGFEFNKGAWWFPNDEWHSLTLEFVGSHCQLQFGISYIGEPFGCLHQLQNLYFSLTQQELTINL